MHTPWIGVRPVAVIPALVTSPDFDPPPADWVDQIRRRIFYDPDPTSGIDRSLCSYVHTISFGKALLEADVFDPVPVQTSHCGAMQDEAIGTLPAGHSYEYACVVFTGGSHSCRGWAFYENPPFPGTSNLRHWCYISTGEGLGVWAMELLHTLTGFGGPLPDHRCPSGWLRQHGLCLRHPSLGLHQAEAQLAGSIPRPHHRRRPGRHLHAARASAAPAATPRTGDRHPHPLHNLPALLPGGSAPWGGPLERATLGVSAGLPSEGVVVYEIDEAVWAPVHLRAVLAAGQSYNNQTVQLQISVTAQVPGGFTATVQSTEHPTAQQSGTRSPKRRRRSVASRKSSSTQLRGKGSDYRADPRMARHAADCPATRHRPRLPVALSTTVPRLVGMKTVQAKTVLSRRGLHWTITYKSTSRFASGTVISQSSNAGAEVRPGASIALVNAKTPPPPTTAPAPPTTAAPRNCDPAYPDVCLHQGIGDYDCAGDSGNGPNYVEGPIRVLHRTRSTWTATTTTGSAARAGRPKRHPSPAELGSG